MHWLEIHVYLAAWLSLIVALISLFMQNLRGNFQQIDWSRSLIYIAFLTGLAVAISPTFDERARTAGWILVSTLIWFLIIDRKQR
jgi:hypothetical protein